MKRHEMALRAFPKPWREQFGRELVATFESCAQDGLPVSSLEIVRAGLHERARRWWWRLYGRRSTRFRMLSIAPLVTGLAVAVSVLHAVDKPNTGRTATTAIASCFTNQSSLASRTRHLCSDEAPEWTIVRVCGPWRSQARTVLVVERTTGKTPGSEASRPSSCEK